jgi:hypothetical protein
MRNLPRGGEGRGTRAFGPLERLSGTPKSKDAGTRAITPPPLKPVAGLAYAGSVTDGCGQTKTKKLEIPDGRG